MNLGSLHSPFSMNVLAVLFTVFVMATASPLELPSITNDTETNLPKHAHCLDEASLDFDKVVSFSLASTNQTSKLFRDRFFYDLYVSPDLLMANGSTVENSVDLGSIGDFFYSDFWMGLAKWNSSYHVENTSAPRFPTMKKYIHQEFLEKVSSYVESNNLTSIFSFLERIPKFNKTKFSWNIENNANTETAPPNLPLPTKLNREPTTSKTFMKPYSTVSAKCVESAETPSSDWGLIFLLCLVSFLCGVVVSKVDLKNYNKFLVA